MKLFDLLFRRKKKENIFRHFDEKIKDMKQKADIYYMEIPEEVYACLKILHIKRFGI